METRFLAISAQAISCLVLNIEAEPPAHTALQTKVLSRLEPSHLHTSNAYCPRI